MRTLTTILIWLTAILLIGCSLNSDVAIRKEKPQADSVSTNECRVAYIGAGQDGADFLLVITDEELRSQPELDLRRNLPPVSHTQAIDLAIGSLRKEFVIDSYFVEVVSLERLVPQQEDPAVNALDWNWYKGKFYWRVELSWYEQKDGSRFLYGFGVTRCVLMTGKIIQPVMSKGRSHPLEEDVK